jgi:pimeloyl-ACP methyl ester carboxylesterase
VTDEIWAEQRALAPAGTVFLEIPDAAHHIMVDQPWALVEAIRSIAAGEVVSAASQ